MTHIYNHSLTYLTNYAKSLLYPAFFQKYRHRLSSCLHELTGTLKNTIYRRYDEAICEDTNRGEKIVG
ncbi:hypothetical protein [Microscilla marina]|uniref:hypothetical protein n=1 Tax=Microscilla marina TaxID=1027 RepID=UPI0012F85C6A|nr:hypothetical protein [Microscilla marina]